MYIDGPGILSQANLEYGQNPQLWCHPSLQVLFNFIALPARSHMQNYLKSFKGDKPLYFNLYDSEKKVKLTLNSRKQKVKITSEFLNELKGQEWLYKLN